MIKVIKGNIVEAQTDVIAHQVNCQGVMRTGVAKDIRAKWPKVYNRYRKIYGRYYKFLRCYYNLGKCQYISIKSSQNVLPRYIVNLFAQDDYGYDGKQYTDLDALESCFANLGVFCEKNNYSLALPYKIGCGRGGADWDEIYKLIQTYFGKIEVELWNLQE